MPKISQLDQLDLNQSYSYADYATWQLKEAVELIKGKIMLMSPAPNVAHQSISGKRRVSWQREVERAIESTCLNRIRVGA